MHECREAICSIPTHPHVLTSLNKLKTIYTDFYDGPGGHSMCHVTSDSTYVLKGDLYVLIECDCVGVYVPIAINYVPCDK